MPKTIDLNKSVYELTRTYPELIDIMAELGFKEITKKGMLRSVGKLMTIPKGAKMKGIAMTDVVAALMKAGFELEGQMPNLSAAPKAEPADAPKPESESRTAQLKGYLKRLGAGEDLEAVRADFAAHFSDVDASEIMKAEQELLEDGTPLTEVQKLCDVHSALFHGATTEERIANAEKAVAASLMRQKAEAERAQAAPLPKRDYTDKNAKAAALAAIPGHPLNTLTRENDAFTALLEKFRADRDAALLPEIRELAIHYAKKGDLLYPPLKVTYGVSGPSDVMWTVDDEIRDELSALAQVGEHDADWQERMDKVLTRAEEMIYKEQNILFPICAVNFTEAEWAQIYRDSKDYATCFGVERATWPEGEGSEAQPAALMDGEIVMPGGRMTVAQLTALLNTIPMEISFIDADNINRYFNEGEKVFKRPQMALGREVFSCHPPKIEPMVRAILDDFRTGKQDRVPVWMEKHGRPMLVTYTAVRDRSGKYLGTVELVQDMTEAQAHFSESGAAEN